MVTRWHSDCQNARDETFHLRIEPKMTAREIKLRNEADDVKDRRRGMRLAAPSPLPAKPAFTIAVCEKIFSTSDAPSPVMAIREIERVDPGDDLDVSTRTLDVGRDENSTHVQMAIAAAALVTAGLVGFLIGRRK